MIYGLQSIVYGLRLWCPQPMSYLQPMGYSLESIVHGLQSIGYFSCRDKLSITHTPTISIYICKYVCISTMYLSLSLSFALYIDILACVKATIIYNNSHSIYANFMCMYRGRRESPAPSLSCLHSIYPNYIQMSNRLQLVVYGHSLDSTIYKLQSIVYGLQSIVYSLMSIAQSLQSAVHSLWSWSVVYNQALVCTIVYRLQNLDPHHGLQTVDDLLSISSRDYRL